MAPRKEKDAKERLRDRIDECNVNFEGPVPQKYWPEQYRHHFGIIRKIWATRYEEYTQGRDKDPQTINQQITRVRDLRNKASSLRKNLSINEATWRELEKLVFKRYDEEVICHRCKNEKWKPDYLAEPFDHTDRAKLAKKRKKRNGCQCHLGIESTTCAYDDSDDECESAIFNSAISAEVIHDPDDRFEKHGIPMHPDRVVGLSRTTRFQNDIASSPLELKHCPINGMDILYPFLVLEAKREDDAPGFRAIERQTAFPLRRLLKLQDALQKACTKNLDPLVWFFAYQGEVWRLYAGTLVDSNLRVYDLWLGTVESHDGALQLFQIVDFIWTWARDIYRRQIRNCLRSHDADCREWSPTSTNPFARSESVFSMSSFRSISHALLETRENSVMPSENGFYIYGNIQDASSHPFLKWANYSDVSAPWIAQTSIRHANIVALSFRVLLMPNFREVAHTLLYPLFDEDMWARSWDVLEALQQSSYSILLRRRHIWQLAKHWTGEDMSPYDPSSATNSDEVIRAVFFFRTICQSDTWQIKREVYCIMSTFTGTEIEPHPDEEFLLNQRLQVLVALAQVRNIFGKESVSYALRNCSSILRHSHYPNEGERQLQWGSPSDQDNASVKQYLALFSSATRDPGISQLYYRHSVGPLQVLRAGEMAEVPLFLPRISEDAAKAGAMLAVRPSSWPAECPRFCLFVLTESGIDNKARLGRLLHDVIKERNFYFADSDTARGQPKWSAADWKLLRDWEALFSLET